MGSQMRGTFRVGLILMLPALVCVYAAAASAQPQTQPSGTDGAMGRMHPQTQPTGGGGPGMSMEGQGQAQPAQMDKMDRMAEAMTAMAQTCQTMMQREERNLRYVLIGLSIVGILFFAALVLFIVLEVQWIRFFGVRIQTEKRRLT